MKRSVHRAAAVLASLGVAGIIGAAVAPAASAAIPRPPGTLGCENTSAPRQGIEGLLWGAAYGPDSQMWFTHCAPVPYGEGLYPGYPLGFLAG